MGVKLLIKESQLQIFNPEVAPPPGDFLVIQAKRDLWIILPIVLYVLTFAATIVVTWLFLSLFFVKPATAHDDGRYANEPLHAWFGGLASGKGLCCSFADGVTIRDVDWDVLNGKFRVRINRQWVIVPENAVVQEPNRFGAAVVWPYMDSEGATQIRCFLPGAGA